ncbi:hypothetical protein I7I50_03119 [Histoplasma capsulatum G186AR]|uniref:Uncharacterized protein n=1 Tax=Ajellomyces capsulatus TaxID=5037 RepID=A0A8H8D6E5_AJECA|nr:hypothetical protein I7I52_00212 [Histoplasma capsulatum]QSS72063.1 hypothetical protein I7I50_03119 [Histoplasma capsulatum G186AR]
MWKKSHDKPVSTAKTVSETTAISPTSPNTEASTTIMATSTTTTKTAPARRLFRYRSKSPCPSPIDTSSATTTETNNSDTPSSTTTTTSTTHSGQRTTSPAPFVASPTTITTTTPTTPTQSHVMRKRHSNPLGHPKRKSSGGSSLSDNRRLSGTVNHCGRHANDWLFGGFSVRESVGRLWNGGNESGEEGEGNGDGEARGRRG